MLTQSTTTTQGLRAAAVAKTIDAIREVVAHGISRNQSIFRGNIFRSVTAPRIYRLSEDSDGRFAMYASVGALHLPMYGRSLEQLPQRITFENESGRRHNVFGPPKVHEPITG